MLAGQNYWFVRRHRKSATQTASANLASATDDINTFGKYPHKRVTDIDTLTLYEAQGAAATDAWHPVGVADNSADVVPA